MFAFAKNLVRSTAEGIIQNASGHNASNTNHSHAIDKYMQRADPTHGFRILYIKQHSPAEQAGLESLFDFIVGINGHDIVGGSSFTPFVPNHYQQNYQNESQNQYIPANNDTGAANTSANPYAPGPATSAAATGGYSQLVDPQNPYNPQFQQQTATSLPANQQYQPQQPYQPQQGLGHSRRQSSVSFPSTAILVPQLLPPQAESSPIEPFLAEIANCRGRSISLDIWSSKGHTLRTVVVPVPSNDDAGYENENINNIYGQNTPKQNTLSSGLGLSLQWAPLSAADHVWHVLNVSANSPAEEAGLISHSDYIVGAERGLLEQGGEDLLGRVITQIVNGHSRSRAEQQEENGKKDEKEGTLEKDEEKDDFDEKDFEKALLSNKNSSAEKDSIVNSQPEVELYVYNKDFNTLRPVRIRPNSSWGGSGLLGCGVGYGLLHRLPAVYSHSGQVSGSRSGNKNGQEKDANNNYGFEYQQQQYHQHQQQQGYNPGSPFGPGNEQYDSSNFFVPANAQPPSSSQTYIPPHPLASQSSTPSSSTHLPPPPPSISITDNATLNAGLVHSTRKKHTYHSGSDNKTGGSNTNPALQNDLAAYFEEEEKKSKELDGYIKSSSSAVDPDLPPPPAMPGFGK